MLVIGHRGAKKYAPENTLSGIRAGLQMGVDFVEVDVHQSLDSVVVIIHDKTLDRTTDGSGPVKGSSLETLKKLDAGSFFSSDFVAEPIPTLAEALDLIVEFRENLPPDVKKPGIWIELKSGEEAYPGICGQIIEAIKARDAFEWAHVISFNRKALKRIHQLESRVKLQLLVLTGRVSLKKWPEIWAIGVYYKTVNPALVQRAHALGKALNVWTVNDPKDALRLREMGVDGITTDLPDLIGEACR